MPLVDAFFSSNLRINSIRLLTFHFPFIPVTVLAEHAGFIVAHILIRGRFAVG